MPCLVLWFVLGAGLPSNVRSRSRCAPASCAKARLTRRVLPSRRLPHIRQRAEFSLPCLGVYHWLGTQAPLTPARQDRSSYATFASARLRHGVLALLGNIDCLSLMLHPPSAAIRAAMLRRRIRLFALRRVSPRIRRTASAHVAQFGTRPLVPCLTFHEARFSSQHLRSPTSRQLA